MPLTLVCINWRELVVASHDRGAAEDTIEGGLRTGRNAETQIKAKFAQLSAEVPVTRLGPRGERRLNPLGTIPTPTKVQPNSRIYTRVKAIE